MAQDQDNHNDSTHYDHENLVCMNDASHTFTDAEAKQVNYVCPEDGGQIVPVDY